MDPVALAVLQDLPVQQGPVVLEEEVETETFLPIVIVPQDSRELMALLALMEPQEQPAKTVLMESPEK